MIFNDFGDIQILLGPVLEHWNRPTYWAFLRNSIIFGIVSNSSIFLGKVGAEPPEDCVPRWSPAGV
mgnify:CR=1 FL=1